jgi:hypothetical protein
MDWFIDFNYAIFYTLYTDKSSVWLNEFWCPTLPIEEVLKIKDEVKKLDITLNYLYPLIRDGKLEAQIMLEFNSKDELREELKKVSIEWQKVYIQSILDSKKVESKCFNRWKEFTWAYKFKKANAQEAVQEIKRKWLEIEDKDKRDIFEAYDVHFKLPEWVCLYDRFLSPI